ncbi:hypothetical protein Peur_022116 [Populus x canadensis]
MPQTIWIWIWICIFLYARWLKYFFIVEMQCVDCQEIEEVDTDEHYQPKSHVDVTMKQKV